MVNTDLKQNQDAQKPQKQQQTFKRTNYYHLYICKKHENEFKS